MTIDSCSSLRKFTFIVSAAACLLLKGAAIRVYAVDPQTAPTFSTSSLNLFDPSLGLNASTASLTALPSMIQGPSTDPADPVVSSDTTDNPIIQAPAPENAVVTDIVFVGNAIHKAKALEKKVKTKRRKLLNKNQLRDDVKLLFETGDFDDVTADVDYHLNKKINGKPTATVIFTVVERPIIKRIDYKGDRQIKSSSFSEKLQSQEGNPFDKYKAAIDARSILEYYREEGYANAQVEYYTSLDSKNKQLILTYFIVEGERVLVKSITIDGTKFFKPKKIQKLMKLRVKKVFKGDQFLQDEKTILAFYKNNGFLDVQISSSNADLDPERNTVAVYIKIEEGPRYDVGTINIASSTIFTQSELRKAVMLKPRKLFEQGELDDTVTNIHGLYADKGYLRTEIIPIPTRHPEEGKVDFYIDINESTVVYVDGVYVDGNTYTKTYVVKREVLLKPGDIFSASRMRRSVERIYNLGYLEDINVDIQQPKSPDLVDLIFSVKEGKPGVFSAGAGFSSVDRFVGNIQVSHNNLFGKGQKLDLSYEFGARRQNFTIGWTDPWFLGYRMSGGIDLFNSNRNRDYPGYYNSYKERRQGVALRLGPRLADDVSLNFIYTLQQTNVYDVDPAIKQDLFASFGLERDEAAVTSSVKQMKSDLFSELALDTRDNRFDATRGHRSSAALGISGGPFGGDINYVKPTIATAWYFPTFWKFVLTLSGRASWANKFAPSSDVPDSERFSLGGPDTVRGYEINSIAVPNYVENTSGITQLKYTPGRIMTLYNAEYKFPIVQEKNKTIFQGAFFLDVGGVWEHSDNIKFTTGTPDSKLKAGAGFGFRFKTPVFPIRLDFGFPLNPRPANAGRPADPVGLQPYFTIGNIF